MTQNGIKWFKLCGFSGLIYNTIFFHCQKVQILKKQKENYPPHPFPLQLSTDKDRQTATLKKQKTTLRRVRSYLE